MVILGSQLDTFQSANYVFFLAKIFQAGSFAYELHTSVDFLF